MVDCQRILTPVNQLKTYFFKIKVTQGEVTSLSQLLYQRRKWCIWILKVCPNLTFRELEARLWINRPKKALSTLEQKQNGFQFQETKKKIRMRLPSDCFKTSNSSILILYQKMEKTDCRWKKRWWKSKSSRNVWCNYWSFRNEIQLKMWFKRSMLLSST